MILIIQLKNVFAKGCEIMQVSDIINIQNGILYYIDKDEEKSIVLQESADVWYDRFHKKSIFDVLFNNKKKNKYAGTKSFCIDGIAYLYLFGEGREYRFEMLINASNISDKRKEWDELNSKLNSQGYWLLDWS